MLKHLIGAMLLCIAIPALSSQQFKDVLLERTYDAEVRIDACILDLEIYYEAASTTIGREYIAEAILGQEQTLAIVEDTSDTIYYSTAISLRFDRATTRLLAANAIKLAESCEALVTATRTALAVEYSASGVNGGSSSASGQDEPLNSLRKLLKKAKGSLEPEPSLSEDANQSSSSTIRSADQEYAFAGPEKTESLAETLDMSESAVSTAHRAKSRPQRLHLSDQRSVEGLLVHVVDS